VRLAYVYLCGHPIDAAVERMKASLLAFLAHLGVDPGKYHETITRAWIMAVDHFMQRSGGSYDSAASFMQANPVLLDSKIMLTHYSAEVLFSPEARRSFVQPDIQPIPPSSPTAAETANLAAIRAYLEALQRGDVGKELAKFFTPDARQVEFPNALNVKGGMSDLTTLLRRAEHGRRLLQGQRYTLKTAIAQGDRVAVEVDWTGVLATPLGSLSAGTVMRASIAMFFVLADGRIRSQHNYDCFAPW
jgi:ketosteroid isomerase-like protein